MLRILLLTLMLGASRADPLGGTRSQQQEDLQADTTCGDCIEAANNVVKCQGEGVKNIPSDCPIDTKFFEFRTTKVADITAGAFQRYTQLTTIRFVDNLLESIDKGAFRGLEHLDSLEFLTNALSDTSFPLERFEGLSSLKKLNLRKNPLTVFPLHLFANSEGLQEISLALNKLKSLNASMFLQMPKLETLYLNNNPITVVHNGHVFKEISSLKTLDLTSNPIHCDCKASWILEAKQADETWTMGWDEVPPKCGTPIWMYLEAITELYADDLTCETPVIKPITPTNTSHTTGGAFKLKSTMERGFPQSKWVFPDGRTKTNDGTRSNSWDGTVSDRMNDTDHSVVTTLTIDDSFDMTGLVNFTLIASNVAGESRHTFWVLSTASGVGGPPQVCAVTLLIMLIYTMVFTE